MPHFHSPSAGLPLPWGKLRLKSIQAPGTRAAATHLHRCHKSTLSGKMEWTLRPVRKASRPTKSIVRAKTWCGKDWRARMNARQAIPAQIGTVRKCRKALSVIANIETRSFNGRRGHRTRSAHRGPGDSCAKYHLIGPYGDDQEGHEYGPADHHMGPTIRHEMPYVVGREENRGLAHDSCQNGDGDRGKHRERPGSQACPSGIDVCQPEHEVGD